MFSKELSFDGHTREFSVDALVSEGWEVRVTVDRRVVRHTVYSDWHRVERAIGAFEREVQMLESQGWRTTTEESQSTKR